MICSTRSLGGRKRGKKGRATFLLLVIFVAVRQRIHKSTLIKLYNGLTMDWWSLTRLDNGLCHPVSSCVILCDLVSNQLHSAAEWWKPWFFRQPSNPQVAQFISATFLTKRRSCTSCAEPFGHNYQCPTAMPQQPRMTCLFPLRCLSYPFFVSQNCHLTHCCNSWLGMCLKQEKCTSKVWYQLVPVLNSSNYEDKEIHPSWSRSRGRLETAQNTLTHSHEHIETDAKEKRYVIGSLTFAVKPHLDGTHLSMLSRAMSNNVQHRYCSES